MNVVKTGKMKRKVGRRNKQTKKTEINQSQKVTIGAKKETLG